MNNTISAKLFCFIVAALYKNTRNNIYCFLPNPNILIIRPITIKAIPKQYMVIELEKENIIINTVPTTVISIPRSIN